MVVLISEAISAILQLAAFTLIPFIVFLFRKDRALSFTRFIGLTAPGGASIVMAAGLSLLFTAGGLGLAFISNDFRAMLFDPHSVTGKLRALGPDGTGVACLLLIAWVKTSLSEEILFRGFIARGLIGKLGFGAGNIFQALIFGAVHLALFWAIVGASVVALGFIFAFSTLAGWMVGLVKTRYANGSILPGWIAHGLGNTMAYAVVAYALPA